MRGGKTHIKQIPRNLFPTTGMYCIIQRCSIMVSRHQSLRSIQTIDIASDLLNQKSHHLHSLCCSLGLIVACCERRSFDCTVQTAKSQWGAMFPEHFECSNGASSGDDFEQRWVAADVGTREADVRAVGEEPTDETLGLADLVDGSVAIQ